MPRGSEVLPLRASGKCQVTICNLRRKSRASGWSEPSASKIASIARRASSPRGLRALAARSRNCSSARLGLAVGGQRRRETVARFAVVGIARHCCPAARPPAAPAAACRFSRARNGAATSPASPRASSRATSGSAPAASSRRAAVAPASPSARAEQAIGLGAGFGAGDELAQRRLGGGAIPGARRLLGLLQLDELRARRQRGQPFAHHVGRLRAHELGHHCAVPECLHGGDAADLVLRGQRRRSVGVHLGQLDAAIERRDLALQHRPEDPAWPTPRRPEVDDHRHLVRAGEHLGIELSLGNILDVSGWRGSHRRNLARLPLAPPARGVPRTLLCY